MANLKQTEKLILEKLFEMDSGYVLDFSNATFQQFIFDVCKLDIYNQKYAIYGDSKAKRLRTFWQIESDKTVGILTNEMLAYVKTKRQLKNIEISKNEAIIFNDCLRTANRLRGVSNNNSKTNAGATREEFMKKEFGNLTLDKLEIDSRVTEILKQRIIEIQKNIETKSSLSAVILCGSVLEGILLGMATKYMREFNSSPASPKNRETNKVKPFPDWTLSNFIDVAYSVGLIGLDVKKYGHSLRDFRNYIHPYQQLSSEFSPDIDTALMSWQVLQSAINDLIKKKKQ